MRVWPVLASLLLLQLILNTAYAAPQHPAHKRPAKAAQPVPPPPPAPPPPPPTLQQMPAVPPQVRFSQGLLTIVAENSTLGDILRAVRARTGAMVEIPANATERVVTHLGPGPARDVLASLLNGTHFNYVMLGSAAHPDSVDRLILTSKSGVAPEPGAVMPQVQSQSQAPMDDGGVQGEDIAEQPADDSPENSADEENPGGQPQVKTPEQLLRELQQQQLQQQQQQSSGTPPPQGGPN